MPDLSNIREFLGWAIGCKIVDITAGDPKDIPDADLEDDHYIIIHLDNGGTIDVPIGNEGFSFYDPNRNDGT